MGLAGEALGVRRVSAALHLRIRERRSRAALHRRCAPFGGKNALTPIAVRSNSRTRSISTMFKETKLRERSASVKARPSLERKPAPLGRRERNKRDKMVRIEQAARRLFSRQGFEATTIRQIAAAADIGLGTFFSYAANKSDLLVLIFQDEVGRAVERAFANVP